MPLRFIRLDYALRATIELYEIDTISQYIYLYELAEKDNFWNTELQEKEDLLFRTQNLLTEEIEQQLLSSSGNAFAYFFKLLNDVVESEDIKEVNYKRIENDIERHNAEMRATKNEDELNPVVGAPLIINTSYIHRYSIFVGGAILYLKNIIEPYLKLYNEGKLLPNNIPINSIQPISLPPATKNIDYSKIKVNITVEQLAALFRLLTELKPEIFSFKNKTDLYNFLANSFETKNGNQSPKNIGNNFTTLSDKAIGFWEVHLNTMLDCLRKIKKFQKL